MSQDESNFDPELSERFARDLGALYHADVSIPRSTDDAILRSARVHFARRRSRQLVLRIGALITAAAAVIVIVVHLSHPPEAHQPVAMNATESHQSVDIVDALKLARRIRAGQAARARDDINPHRPVD